MPHLDGGSDTVGLLEWRVCRVSFACCKLTVPAASVVSGPMDLRRCYLLGTTVTW